MKPHHVLHLIREQGELRFGLVRRHLGEWPLTAWAPPRLRSLALRIPRVWWVRYAVTDLHKLHSSLPLLGDGFLFQRAHLASPHGVACGSGGHLVVADSGKHRILLLARDGRVRRRIHHAAEGRVQLQFPTSVAVAGNGDIWVLNSGADALHRYDARGNYRGDARGLPRGALLEARGLALGHGGTILVCATQQQRVHLLDTAGWPHPHLAESELAGWTFAAPVAVAQAADGRIAVCDAWRHRVEFFSPRGRHLRSLGGLGEALGQFNEPSACAFLADGTLLVLERGGNRLQALRPDGGAVALWGRRGSALLGERLGELWGATGLAVDTERNQAVIADTGNHRLQRVNLAHLLAGKPRPTSATTRRPPPAIAPLSAGAPPLAPLVVAEAHARSVGMPLRSPHGLLAVAEDQLWVADTGNHRLVRYSWRDRQGDSAGRFGWGAEEFINPIDAAVVGDTIYLLDALNCRLHRYNRAGRWRGTVDALGDLEYPRSIAYDPESGLLALAEPLCARLRVYGPRLHLRWGARGPAEGLGAPAWVRWHRGELYVADAGLNRIAVFDRAGKLLRTWGHLGRKAGALNRPLALTPVDGDYCAVADAGNHRLQFYTLRGEWVRSWRPRHDLEPQLHPRGLLWKSATRELIIAAARRPTLLMLRIDPLARVSRPTPSPNDHLDPTPHPGHPFCVQAP